MPKSKLEDAFLAAWLARCPDVAPVREYQFAVDLAPPRRWKFDFAFVPWRVAVEIEGGAFTAGRHSTGGGLTKDCEKYNAAAALGWRVFRFTAPHLRQPKQKRKAASFRLSDAVSMIQNALGV